MQMATIAERLVVLDQQTKEVRTELGVAYTLQGLATEKDKPLMTRRSPTCKHTYLAWMQEPGS